MTIAVQLFIHGPISLEAQCICSFMTFKAIIKLKPQHRTINNYS